MKKHTLLTKVMAGGLVTVTLLGVAFAAGQQGTQSDPLVTLSYLTQKATPEIMNQVETKLTEREAARFIESRYAALGCSGPSFPTIVSFGAHGADPHHEPDDTPLTPGDSIVIDMGCRKDRYCSDMTRTYFWKEASGEARAVHDLVRRANEQAEALVKPGVPLCALDKAARDLIAGAGYGEFFTHRLGHFIGQRDHEQGDVSSANTALAEPGMIFSIEPGIYLPGRFGVRIEDLVLVTETGCEVLNRVDKHCRVLG